MSFLSGLFGMSQPQQIIMPAPLPPPTYTPDLQANQVTRMKAALRGKDRASTNKTSLTNPLEPAKTTKTLLGS